MAPANNNRRKIDNNQQTMIRCMQINRQHLRIATDNLMNLIEQKHTDILFVQEPYYFKTIQKELQELTRPIYPPKTGAGQPL